MSSRRTTTSSRRSRSPRKRSSPGPPPYPTLETTTKSSNSSTSSTSSTSKQHQHQQHDEIQLLLKLSEGCNTHRSYHHGSNTESSKIRQEPYLQEHELPERCRKDIAALHQILPRVERAFHQQPQQQQQHHHHHPTNVAHLCDFYMSVLRGQFCPHAPHLFRWGKDGEEILPRVLWLFQYLTSKELIQNTISASGNKGKDTTNTTTSSTPVVVDTICRTMAHLLHLIPESKLQDCIVQDMLNLLVDLATIAEANLVVSEAAVQVSILDSTLREATAANRAADKTGNHVVSIQSLEVLYSFQAAILDVLLSLLKLNKKKALHPSEDVPENLNVVQHANADALFYGIVGHHLERTCDLLACLRSVLWTDPKKKELSSNKLRLLIYRNKLAAADVLEGLLEDWHSCGAPPLCILTEAAHLIGRACLVHFGTCHEHDETALLKQFSRLVCRAIVMPPVNGKSPLVELEATCEIQRAAIVSLLDCLRHTGQLAAPEQVKFAGVVLRAIHVALHVEQQTASSANSLAALIQNHLEAQGIYPFLFHLIQHNAQLTYSAVAIVSAIATAPSDFSKALDISNASQWAMSGDVCDTKLRSAGGQISETLPRNEPAESSSLPASDSKKRCRSPLRGPVYQVEPLTLERSPKRQRSIENTALVVTPSRLQHDVNGSHAVLHSPPSGNSMEETLGNLLAVSHGCANRILAMADPTLDLLDTRASAQVRDDLMYFLRAICGSAATLTVLLSVDVWALDAESATAYDEKNPSAFVLLGILMKALLHFASSLMTRLSASDDTSVEEAVQLSLELLINLGLHVHFSLDTHVVSIESEKFKTCTECLDAIATCATAAWLRFPCSPIYKATESQQTKCIVCANLGNTKSVGRAGCSLVESTPCLCGLIKLPISSVLELVSETDWRDRAATSRNHVFQRECAILLLHNLPLQTRLGLFACLHRPERATKHPCSQIVASCSTAAPSETQASPALTLELLPLYLLSVLAYRQAQEGMGQVDDLISLLSNINPTILLDRDRADEDGASGYSSFHRIQELIGLTLKIVTASQTNSSAADFCIAAIKTIVRNAPAVVSFLASRPLAQSPAFDLSGLTDSNKHRFSKVDIAYRSARNALLSAPVDVDSDTVPVAIRLAKWKCATRACTDSSLAELRRVVASSPSVGTVRHPEPIDEESSFGLLNPPNTLKWLFFAALADPERSIREFAAAHLGDVLVGGKADLMFALFSTEQECRQLQPELQYNSQRAETWSTVVQVVSRMFEEVDRFLLKYCAVPPSQLSLTMGSGALNLSAGSEGARLRHQKAEDAGCFQYTAILALSSLCRAVDIEKQYGIIVFENAILRLVRFWTSGASLSSPEDSIASTLTTSSIPGLAFGEIVKLNQIRRLRFLVETRIETFPPALFADVLLPCSDTASSKGVVGTALQDSRLSCFRLLASFVGNFLTDTGNFASSSFPEVLAAVEEMLPHVLSALVIQQDYELLMLTTAFKLFLLGEERKTAKLLKQSISSIDGALGDRQIGSTLKVANDLAKVLGVDTRRSDLEEHTKSICLAPDTIETILPRLLMNPDRSRLVFFLQIVLKGKMSLQQMIRSKNLVMLKAIVWELGRDVGRSSHAIQALRTAAIAREQSAAGTVSSPKETGDFAKKSIRDDVDNIVSGWVTPNFMYLLVNVVQYRWKTRTNTERARALRCLWWMTKYLLASEAPQYVPQIMATVNMAMGQESVSPRSSKETTPTWRLRLLAVEALSKFVHLFAEAYHEILGQNLTTVVVSLFPVLSADECSFQEDEDISAAREASRMAVDLLKWLTAGSLGKKLAPYFKDIPFLPPTAALDDVREALRAKGVDFDSLLLLTATQVTQSATSARDSLSGSNADSEKNLPAYSKESLAALRKRITVLTPLLSHESLSVRHAVLDHLTDLLRANRGLFGRLVETEAATTGARYLTVHYGASPSTGFGRGSVTALIESLLQRCVVEADVDTRILIATCWGEVGAIDSHLLGKVNVSSSLREQTLGSGDQSLAWRLANPPWQSHPIRYQLQVVSTHLVVALKAAPTSLDQHKIAFSIQQILVLLDDSAKESKTGSSPFEREGDNDIAVTRKSSNESQQKGEMSAWLRETLQAANVLDTVEPYWHSHFNETDAASSRREPPFFSRTISYYAWLSQWCRYMINRSRESIQTQWCALFYACRTAIRSPVGTNLAEFILPLLVLERMCFGSIDDEKMIIDEMCGVLSISSKYPGDNASAVVNLSERHKAVNTVFAVIDTLQYWGEREIESRHGRTRSQKNKDSRSTDAEPSAFWSSDESLSKIEDLLGAIPLDLRAKAAFSVGMHARSLQLLEISSRSHLVERIYESSSMTKINRATNKENPMRRQAIGGYFIEGIDLVLLKEVLLQLDDYETIDGIVDETDGAKCSLVTIKQKEAKGDWSGALQDYERALQLRDQSEPHLNFEKGLMRCLLELGQYESVLNQANGIIHCNIATSCIERGLRSTSALPFAVEAAWRLGRWSSLEQLLEKSIASDPKVRKFNDEELYQVSVGKAMVGLLNRSEFNVNEALEVARKAVMVHLGSAARESYSRAYDHLVQLQCLREIENARSFMCSSSVDGEENDLAGFMELATSENYEGWNWNGRLEVVGQSDCSKLLSTRVALCRLARNSTLEGSLFLTVGKKARKAGQFHSATNSLAQAEAAFVRARSSKKHSNLVEIDGFLGSVRMQVAKLKHLTGESGAALRMIGYEELNGLLRYSDVELRTFAVQSERQSIHASLNANYADEPAYVERFSRRLVQSTQWMVEGGLKSGSEIMDRFRIIHRLSPKLEKAHFLFAKYVDSVLESRVAGLMHRTSGSHYIGGDEDASRATVLFDDSSCQRYVLLAMNEYIEALRLDSKHLYQALPRLLSIWFGFSAVPSRPSTEGSARSSGSGQIATHQAEANKIISKNISSIPPHLFYTAMPQLISHISHANAETATVVHSILTRLLVKFPAQAMWPLAWLRHSAHPQRAQVGEELFRQAQQLLAKRKDRAMEALLGSSKSLFRYLIDMAKFKPKDPHARSIKLKPWKGEVDLTNFVPPVQAALSLSRSVAKGSSSKDIFPDMVPRMRAFCTLVHVMSSKARPKRLMAFGVSASQLQTRRRLSNSSDDYLQQQPGDIGELHFLLKQEARGDLRKDARVQDLCTVINRLLAASSASQGGGSFRQRRRLYLRTYAVTCLSEDCGILEWVPHTESMRSLVAKSYNPQASPFSNKRRGRRLANFADMTMKSMYEKCQDSFFKRGDLKSAAVLFEDLCKEYPPLLHWWFVQSFLDPHAWYEARNRFTLSAAVWSAIGHVIGLGDRHSENILVDTTSGDCVHVDFDCIFDKGLVLPKPEVVPFRLTPNMLDAFGPVGADGIYTGSLMAAMSTLRHNRDTLLSVLEPFLKDPIIDWKRHRAQQKQGRSSSRTTSNKSETAEARRSIKVIDERLRGIYNLRNPNFQKVTRTDGWSVDQDDEMTHMMPLSVEGQVHKMIAEATSHENLVQLYVGWMPWV